MNYTDGMARNSDVSSLPNDRWSDMLFNEALTARIMLERAWSPETAYQGITLTPEDVPSRGQCGVTSLWFARHLRRRGVDAYFVEGRTHLDGMDEEYVWVEARRPGVETRAIDLTSDQHQTFRGTMVNVGVYETEGTISRYEPLLYFDPFEVPHKKMLGRFAILEANIARLPRRHRMKILSYA
jgi:hypothetical protein